MALSWTNGETDEGVEILVDGTGVDTVPANSTAYTVTGLSQSTSYTFGVRHRDAYGGVSSTVTDTESTTAVDPTLNAPTQIHILKGESIGTQTAPP
jgi:hypothetical protein